VKKIKLILINSLPILLMIGLIPLIWDDYILTWVYILISLISLMIHREKNDGIFYLLGFFFMLISESIFISTGVEIFLRNSLFGLMPLWLPFLWAYGFVAIKRLMHIIEER
jgi:hypothetical protein